MFGTVDLHEFAQTFTPSSRLMRGVSKADRGPVGLDQTAVSVSHLVLETRIDAEFLSDMGELFRVHEPAVCHHRAQGR
jgi:hypothetical protein